MRDLDAADELDEINRIHDDDPEVAAARLRALDLSALPSDGLPLAAFLVNHLLGEKLDAWSEASRRLAALLDREPPAPPGLIAQAAVAEQLAAGNESRARAALQALGPSVAADCLIELRVLTFTRDRGDVASFATRLRDATARAAAISEPTTLDDQLAAALNNATSLLLDLAPEEPDPVVRDALRLGTEETRRFWRRAGTWVQNERALYLVALVENRLGGFAAARDAAREGLELIAANGPEPVDEAFLQLQLAGALRGLGDTAESERIRSAAKERAARWDDASLGEWLAAEDAKLFDARAPRPERRDRA